MSDLGPIQPLPSEPEAGASRRDVFRILAAGATVAAATPALAQHEHHHAAAAAEPKKAGPYQPKALTTHEYATLERLAELIVPADEGGPSAKDAGAAEYIDFMCSRSPELKDIYTGGLSWMDRAMQRRVGALFVKAEAEQQRSLLDLIAYRANRTPELGAGVEFFAWCRKMVVDGYYTSRVGAKDVGYKGNVGMAVFKIPDEALQYALGRSPFKA